MSNTTEKIVARGSLALNRYFHAFFADDMAESTHQAPVDRVLPVQPVKQRKLFTQLAIQDHRNIFMQLNPLTSAGQIINCRGILRSLPNGCFLLQNDKVSYIFTLNQIRYIAG
ncbi:hypothetical protein [Limosilactobacillus caecicola]|uniref:hypothetical protein n=1 Tax=Limosilactobacillus caecicola TaxID=2941332 RepID=UPI00203EEE63|nr:hypothetical protein [Limosilactobacillus caecicola]